MSWSKNRWPKPIGPKPPLSRLALAGFVISALAVAAAAGAGLGTRAGWWNFREGFRFLRWGAYFGAAGTAISAAGGIFARPGSRRRGFLLAIAGIVLGAAAFGVPGNSYRMAKAVPMIHDITTDTENPPEFVSILPQRKDASNPAEYGGPEIAAKQHAAYPDIRPLTVGISLSRAYEAALATARRMNWRIVDGNPSEGRIEAVATTRWFGFKDDIVIRISPAASGGSVLDIRSVSRVGLSDIGTNACRIRKFLKTFTVAAKAGS
jgi:uncharacterized protein (DUF1499 family)